MSVLNFKEIHDMVAEIFQARPKWWTNQLSLPFLEPCHYMTKVISREICIYLLHLAEDPHVRICECFTQGGECDDRPRRCSSNWAAIFIAETTVGMNHVLFQYRKPSRNQLLTLAWVSVKVT